jgi:hypothetical protein
MSKIKNINMPYYKGITSQSLAMTKGFPKVGVQNFEPLHLVIIRHCEEQSNPFHIQSSATS